MKRLVVYDTDLVNRPKWNAVVKALRKHRIEPNFAVENNTVNMRRIGDYNVSGGSHIVFVPDDFETEKVN